MKLDDRISQNMSMAKVTPEGKMHAVIWTGRDWTSTMPKWHQVWMNIYQYPVQRVGRRAGLRVQPFDQIMKLVMTMITCKWIYYNRKKLEWMIDTCEDMIEAFFFCHSTSSNFYPVFLFFKLIWTRKLSPYIPVICLSTDFYARKEVKCHSRDIWLWKLSIPTD